MNPSSAIAAARHAAEAVLAASVSLSAFVFVLGMPFLGLDLGLWRSQEIPAAAIHVLAAAAVLALGVLVATRDRNAAGAVASRPALAMLALAVASLALAPLSDDPWKSVYGALQHGAGGLWHLELAVFIAAAAILLRTRWKLVVLGSAYVSSAAVLVLYAFPFLLGRPMAFHEWSGMLAGAVAMAVFLTTRRLLAWENGAAAALLLAGIAVSENRAVLIAVAAVAAVMAAGRVPFLRQALRRRWFRAGVPVTIAAGGMAVMWAFAPAYEAMRLRDVPDTRFLVGTDRPEDRVNLMWGALGTLWSRSHMVRIVVDEVLSEPSKLFAGNGWGSFSTTYEKHARSVPGRMYPNRGPLSSATYWDAHTKANFHSHNVAAEALNSLGLPGLALWLGFLGALGASSRRGLLASTAIATVSVFWFPLTHMTMAIALLVAAGSRHGETSAKTRQAMANVASAPAAALVAMLGMAGAGAVSLAVLETAEKEFVGVHVDRNPETCRTIQARFLPEKEANIYLHRVLVGRILASEKPLETLFEHGTNVITLSCTLRGQTLDRAHVPSLAESLEARARLAGIGTRAFGFIADDLMAWGHDVETMLKAAPARTDYLIPYFENLRIRRHPQLPSEAMRFAAEIDEGDPVRSYLLATAAEASGDMAAARAHMRDAVKKGYANLVKLSDSYAEELSNGL